MYESSGQSQNGNNINSKRVLLASKNMSNLLQDLESLPHFISLHFSAIVLILITVHIHRIC